MFVNTSAFKKLIKKSWSAEGLTMGATDTEIFFAGGTWVIRVDKRKIPNKIKAAIVELTGELPAAGEVFTCYKKEATQYEVAENEYWNITERFWSAQVELNTTKVRYNGATRDYRILQEEKSKKCILVDNFFTELIDYSAVEEYEDIPAGPVMEHLAAGLIYWSNNVMTIAVGRISVQASAVQTELAAFLEHMETRNLPVIK